MVASPEPVPFRVDVRQQGDSLALALVGDLDASTHGTLLAELDRLLCSYTACEVSIDLSELSFCDSAGVRIIERWCRDLQPPGHVRLVAAPRLCRFMLDHLHLSETFALDTVSA